MALRFSMCRALPHKLHYIRGDIQVHPTNISVQLDQQPFPNKPLIGGHSVRFLMSVGWQITQCVGLTM